MKSVHLLILLAIAVYLFFSLVYIRLPGLEYDELLFVNAALGDIDGTFIEWEPKVLGRKIPLMLMSYIGAAKAFLYAPVFHLFGVSAVTVRLPVVLIGLVTVLVTYALVRRMLGRKPALLSLLLFASDPTFIFANRLDWGPVSLMMALKMSALYFLWRWLTEGRLRLLGIAAFLMGVGVYDKAVFVWFVAALVPSLLLCFRPGIWKAFRPSALAIAVAGFFAGSLPLVAYNIAVPLGTLRNEKLVTRDWRESLRYRESLFRMTFDGSGVYNLINHEDEGEPAARPGQIPGNRFDALVGALARLNPAGGSFTPAALLLAVALILILWGAGRLQRAREALFFICLLVFIAAFICLTEQATGPHHVIMLYPLPHILIAYAVSELSRLGSARLKERIPYLTTTIAIFCLVPLLLAEITVDARYLYAFRIRGGYGAWSDAIYQLADYWRQERDKTFLLMDWGFSTQLLALSQGQIKKEESFVRLTDAPDEEKIARMQPLLAGIGTLLVFHIPPFETYPLYNLFKLALGRYSLEGRLVKTFCQKDGRPIYAVYEVVRPEVEAYLKKGNFFYLREAEQWDAKSGGELDLKEGASRNQALGLFWGENLSDFTLYRFTAPRRLADVRFYVLYAFEGQGTHQYNIFLDANFVDSLVLPPTPGYGYTPKEWRLAETRLGDIGAGPHELKIAPARDYQIVNLDYFYLCEGEFQFDTVSPVPPARPK